MSLRALGPQLNLLTVAVITSVAAARAPTPKIRGRARWVVRVGTRELAAQSRHFTDFRSRPAQYEAIAFSNANAQQFIVSAGDCEVA